MSIKGSRLAQVSDTSAQFAKVTLLDVPEYLTNRQVESYMSYYGNVVHIQREYFEYHGHKLQNETRFVRFLESGGSFLSKGHRSFSRPDGFWLLQVVQSQQSTLCLNLIQRWSF